MQDYDGIVGIYTNQNSLSLKLKEKFSEKYMDVKTFTDFKEISLSSLSYLIINLLDFKNELPKISAAIKDVECKILVLYPLLVKTTEKFVADTELQNLIDLYPNLGVLLVPDVLGEGVDYNEDSLSHQLIMQSIVSERIKITIDSLLVNTISVNKLAEKVVKETFSFGVSGQKIALLGPRKTKRTFLTKYLGIESQNIITTPSESDIVELNSTANSSVDFSLRLQAKNTKKYFTEKTEIAIKKDLVLPELTSILDKPIKTVVKGKASVKIKRLVKILLFILLLGTLPFLLMAISVGLLITSSKTILSNNNLSKILINQSKNTADLAKNMSFGNIFIYDTSNIIYKLAGIGSEGLILSDLGRDFSAKIMSDKNYDLTYYSDSISASLDRIHTEISFLQSDINEWDGFIGKYVRSTLVAKRIDVGEYKDKIYAAKNLSSRIGTLLGDEKPKKYLILFQNNMELRPTGGFIGSFALMTFDKGRLSEIVVNDVYSADGQLKGHVDPPEPIRKYLNEGGWFMRDSNWDPDFRVSAEKAEWFLEKEVNQKVDGVIAIDLNFVQRLLKITGPIKLTDFGVTIDSNNLYQVIQSEVEGEFFAGSTKKAGLLTSLSRNLITEVQGLKGDKYTEFFKEIYESLERNHIQFFIHDSNTQESFSKLGYSGEININTDCGLRCIKDSYSVTDANLGVNKANFYITRSQELNLTVSKEMLNHELFITYTNNASSAVGNPGVYKNYARILVPKEAKVAGVRIYETNGTYKELEYDTEKLDDKQSLGNFKQSLPLRGRAEVGFWFDVLPGTQKRVQVVWSLVQDKLAQGGEYNLNVIKQAGTDEDPFTLNIKTTDLTLTGKSLSSYNTYLARDFKIRMFFKP